jgi:hypothetical protein
VLKLSPPRSSPQAGRMEIEGAHLLRTGREGCGPPESAGSPQSIRSPLLRRCAQAEVAEMTGAGREWIVSMISALSIPCK